MTSNWKECKIEDLNIQIIDGDRGKNYPNKQELLNSGDCLFLSAQNVTKKGFNFGETQWITKEKDNILRNGKLSYGDIVITTRGTVGNVALYSKDIKYTDVRINSGMLIVRCDETIYNKYLYYVLSSNFFAKKILLMQSGTAQPQLPKSHFQKMSIPLPPLETQQKIAKVLSAIDDKIELNNSINNNLEQQAQAIYKSWFVDFEPFCGVMPEDWQTLTLGDVTENIRTRIGTNNYTVLSAVNTGKLQPSDEYFSKQVYSKNTEKYIIVEEGNFAYNPARINIGSIGINELGYIGCVSPVYIAFKVNKDYESFFRFYFKSAIFNEETKTRASGSVRQSLNYSDFALIKINYPSQNIAKQFNELYKTFFKVKKEIEEETQRLIQLRDTLLPKLISAEIDVSNIEIDEFLDNISSDKLSFSEVQ